MVPPIFYFALNIDGAFEEERGFVGYFKWSYWYFVKDKACFVQSVTNNVVEFVAIREELMDATLPSSCIIYCNPNLNVHSWQFTCTRRGSKNRCGCCTESRLKISGLHYVVKKITKTISGCSCIGKVIKRHMFWLTIVCILGCNL